MGDDSEWQERTRRLVMAWDTDEDLEFLAAITSARHALGLTLADDDDRKTDEEVLVANGYTATGEYCAANRWASAESELRRRAADALNDEPLVADDPEAGRS